MPEYNNETGLLALVLTSEVFRIVPVEISDFSTILPKITLNIYDLKMARDGTVHRITPLRRVVVTAVFENRGQKRLISCWYGSRS